MKSSDVRIPDSVICGRKNCTSCGRWRHAFDFGYEQRTGVIYLRSECKPCALKRRRDWYKKLSRKRKEQIHANERQARLRRNGSAKVDAWPVRKWLISKINEGWTLRQLAEELALDEFDVRDLARGYKEEGEVWNCDIMPIRTVEKRLMLRFIEVASMRREPGPR